MSEIVTPLLKTRFKLSFNKAGNCTTFYRSQAEELDGQWVWLIDASDGGNDPLYSAPVQSLEEVGVVEKAGDHLNVSIDDDLTWAEGEKLYRMKVIS